MIATKVGWLVSLPWLGPEILPCLGLIKYYIIRTYTSNHATIAVRRSRGSNAMMYTWWLYMSVTRISHRKIYICSKEFLLQIFTAYFRTVSFYPISDWCYLRTVSCYVSHCFSKLWLIFKLRCLSDRFLWLEWEDVPQ